jgi:hypothetical protein
MDVFRDNTKAIPKSDPQVVRVDMKEQGIGGRLSHLPKGGSSDTLKVSHTANEGTK